MIKDTRLRILTTGGNNPSKKPPAALVRPEDAMLAFWNGEKNFCLARVPTDNVVWIVPDFHASNLKLTLG